MFSIEHFHRHSGVPLPSKSDVKPKWASESSGGLLKPGWLGPDSRVSDCVGLDKGLESAFFFLAYTTWFVDFSSPTREQIQAFSSESTGVLTTGLPRNSLESAFLTSSWVLWLLLLGNHTLRTMLQWQRNSVLLQGLSSSLLVLAASRTLPSLSGIAIFPPNSSLHICHFS